MTSEDIQRQVEKLRKIVEKDLTPNPKKTARAVRKLEEKFLSKLRDYEQQERLLGSRNSYSRTDPDATMFLTATGELLPMYTVMLGTENQFIVNYTTHQKNSETDRFIPHMHQAKHHLGRFPGAIIGDAAYGSEENYAFLERQGIGNYLKYNTFDLTRAQQYFDKDRFLYDPSGDSYRCPEGRTLSFQQVYSSQTPNGYPTEARLYQCNDCTGCSLSARCKRGEGNRTLRVNARLEAYRQQARSNLESDVGMELRRRRYTDVEPTFGDIKWNAGCRRFHLRGKEKVNLETGLLSIAHNIRKIAMTIH